MSLGYQYDKISQAKYSMYHLTLIKEMMIWAHSVPLAQITNADVLSYILPKWGPKRAFTKMRMKTIIWKGNYEF